jgi:hypothetical protein
MLVGYARVSTDDQNLQLQALSASDPKLHGLYQYPDDSKNTGAITLAKKTDSKGLCRFNTVDMGTH